MKLSNSLLTFCLTLLFFAGSPVKKGYDVGDTAIDFKLKNVDGKMVSLANYKEAKGFIIIFDCNTCPYSKAYNDRIIALSKKYSKDFPLIAINSNSGEDSSGDSFEDMIKYAKKKGYDFPYLVDATQEIAKTYGATNTPHIFVLNKEQGNLKVAYIGTIDDNPRNAKSVAKRYVEDAVDALIDGKPVATTKTKAIGCGIKWRDA
ncbi:MAG: thioredoxin family protein [Bacteroidia bacterium]|nr:thioredoxin family protein [Bacteroidia bacterium]